MTTRAGWIVSTGAGWIVTTGAGWNRDHARGRAQQDTRERYAHYVFTTLVRIDAQPCEQSN